jgi:hypothetical protein
MTVGKASGREGVNVMQISRNGAHAATGRGVRVKRREFVTGAVALGLGGAAAATLGGTALARAGSDSAGTRVRLTLPAPTGHRAVGTVAVHLVDHSRQDPFLSVPRPRELMISIWYPARDAQGFPRAPWIPSEAVPLLRSGFIPPPLVQVTGPGGSVVTQPGPPLTIPLDNVDFPVTHARLRVPAAPEPAGCPVLLYSPGDETDREFGTAQAEDLASHGYVVVTIDHTYEAPEVVFPGGRVEVQVSPQPPTTTVLTTRIADARFVLDSLATLAEAGHPRLPAGLPGVIDLSRTGMFGHSLGGDTAAQVMAVDERISAAIDLDGSIVPTVPFTRADVGALAGAVAAQIGDRPFMIMSSAGHGPFAVPGQPQDPTLVGFWANLTGWRLFVTMAAAQHLSYTDYESFLSQSTAAGVISASQAAEVVVPYIGTVDPGRAIAAERAYIRAFFDQQLRHRHQDLLDGPSARYPEITFLASGAA